MNNKEKRASIRHSNNDVYCYINYKNEKSFHQIHDFSDKGVFIKSERMIPSHELVYIEFLLPSDLGLFKTDGIVKRVNWSGRNGNLGLGIELSFESENNVKIWKAYVNYLRNQQIINISKKLINEFFNYRNRY